MATRNARIVPAITTCQPRDGVAEQTTTCEVDAAHHLVLEADGRRSDVLRRHRVRDEHSVQGAGELRRRIENVAAQSEEANVWKRRSQAALESHHVRGVG